MAWSGSILDSSISYAALLRQHKAKLIILCISRIGRGTGGASPSPVIFWIGWKTNGVRCCLASYNNLLHRRNGRVLGWLHRLMLITGLVASREIWRHGIRRTIRKQSQPSRPIVKPTTVSHSFSELCQKAFSKQESQKSRADICWTWYLKIIPLNNISSGGNTSTHSLFHLIPIHTVTISFYC